MSYLIKPKGYKALLNLAQTEMGIKQIKDLLKSYIHMLFHLFQFVLYQYTLIFYDNVFFVH